MSNKAEILFISLLNPMLLTWCSRGNPLLLQQSLYVIIFATYNNKSVCCFISRERGPPRGGWFGVGARKVYQFLHLNMASCQSILSIVYMIVLISMNFQCFQFSISQSYLKIKSRACHNQHVTLGLTKQAKLRPKPQKVLQVKLVKS